MLSSTCGVVLPTDLQTPSLYTYPRNGRSSTSILTVFITDSMRVRSTTVSTTIIVQQIGAPVVKILDGNKGKLFSGSKITLTSSVKLTNPGNATWSLNDTDIDLTTAFLSPITTFLPAGYSPITLTVAAYTMSPGSTLSFVLTAIGIITLFSTFFLNACWIFSPPSFCPSFHPVPPYIPLFFSCTMEDDDPSADMISFRESSMLCFSLHSTEFSLIFSRRC